MQYKIYKLESTFTGYDGIDYPAVYIAHCEIENGEINFTKSISSKCHDGEDWVDTEENQCDVANMMRIEIQNDNAEEI